MFYLNIACRYPWAVQYFILPIFCRQEKRWGTNEKKSPNTYQHNHPHTTLPIPLPHSLGLWRDAFRARPVIIGLVPRMSAAFLRNKLSQSLAGLETAAEGRRSRAVLKEKRMEINYGGQKTSFPSGGVIRRYFDCFLRGTRGGKMLTVSKLCMFCTVCCVYVRVLKSVYLFFSCGILYVYGKGRLVGVVYRARK